MKKHEYSYEEFREILKDVTENHPEVLERWNHKCQWEQMTKWAVLNDWGDPRDWKK